VIETQRAVSPVYIPETVSSTTDQAKEWQTSILMTQYRQDNPDIPNCNDTTGHTASWTQRGCYELLDEYNKKMYNYIQDKLEFPQ